MTDFVNRNLGYSSILVSQFPQLRQKVFYKRMHNYFFLRLHQLGLLKCYQPAEVMAEVICRLDCAIKLGKKIYNLEAWVRRTGLNFIYELSRIEKRYSLVGDNITLESFMYIGDVTVVSSEYEENYTELHEALKLLNPSYQEILKMRYFQCLSWEEIAQIFAARGELVQVQTLRKRGQRALEALRVTFFRPIGM